MLVQWLYLGKIAFTPLKPEEEITLAVYFIRPAYLCEVRATDEIITSHIKDIILQNRGMHGYWCGDFNMLCVSSQHLKSAYKLPHGHAVRKSFTSAAVEGYLNCEKPTFYQEFVDIPRFAGDLFDTIKDVLGTVRQPSRNSISFTEPLSG